MSGREPSGYPARRFVVTAAFVLVTAGLLLRLVDLQLNHKSFLKSQGDARHLRVVTSPAHRGRILDRDGEALAISTPVESVWVNPGEVIAARERWPELAAVLGLDTTRLAAQVDSRREREFVYVSRHVAPEVAEHVLKLGIPGVYLQREYRRYYPLGEVAAHVVGFTNVDDRGQEGLELAYDEHLRGRDGAERVVRDRLGRVVEYVEQISAPRSGEDLRLSIDRRIQYLAYRALLAGVRHNRARGGSVVVLDVGTGEVLAIANQPSYNPNKRSDRVSARFRNRAVTDVFEPGSVIKPFTIAAALESGRYRPDSIVDTTPGYTKVRGHTIHDLRNYGRIDLATIIQKSSNVGATRIALDMPSSDLWQMLARVGFGASTGSGFPGEADGVLTHFLEWGEVEHATHAFGYGMSVTALQLAQAYAVIGSGGLMPRVSFLRVGGGEAKPVRVMSRRTARSIVHMLEGVVGPGGTATRARVPGYRVGGKTGTVRKSIVGGYADDRHISLFAGIAPLSRPRIVAVVVVDEPSGEDYYGGRVAAPVAAEVLAGALRVLGVAPDDGQVVTRRIALGADPASDPGRMASAALQAGDHDEVAR